MSYTPPTALPATQSSGNPLKPVYQAAPPQVAPTTSNADVSPQSAISQLQSANALTNAQQQNNLSNLLAANGISGNDAISAQNSLAGQLNASQAGALASLITNAQGMGLGQSEFNAGAGNQASALNLSSILGTNSANTNAANTAGQQLASALLSNYGLDMGAFTNLLDAGLGGQQSLNSSGLSGLLNLGSQTAGAQNSDFSSGLNNLISAAVLFGGG